MITAINFLVPNQTVLWLTGFLKSYEKCASCEQKGEKKKPLNRQNRLIFAVLYMVEIKTPVHLPR